MAKQDTQDFRIDFIEAIAQTDNLKILRSIASQMESNQYSLNISNKDVLDMLKEGVKQIKLLLGNSAKSFTPLKKINDLSVQTFFEKVSKGYKELKEKEAAKIHLEKQRNDLKVKISKYKSKNKFDKVKEMEYRLFCIDFPKENLDKIADGIQIVEEKYKQGILNEEEYKSLLKDLKKSKKLSENVMKITNLMLDTENIAFYRGIQEDVRNFLCYNFFSKRGKVSESPNRFLMTYEGEIVVDFEHMLLLYNYLKSIHYSNLNEVEGVLYYTAIEQFYRDVSPFILNKINGIYLKQSPTEFYSEKFEGYTRKYMTCYLVPKGYKGYVFEPANLLTQSFIAATEDTDLTIDTMVVKYKNAQSIMRDRKEGIFYNFLSSDLENRLIKKLVTSDFPLDEMNGSYREVLLNEFRDRRDTFGVSDSFDVMTDMYSRVIKPYALEVLGSYVRNFCYNLVNLKDKKMIYIYYVSPERIAIAVREDVTDEMLEEVFPKKFLENLQLIDKPVLEDIVFGEYL